MKKNYFIFVESTLIFLIQYSVGKLRRPLSQEINCVLPRKLLLLHHITFDVEIKKLSNVSLKKLGTIQHFTLGLLGDLLAKVDQNGSFTNAKRCPKCRPNSVTR
jgi:hypothetical protein